MPNVPARYTDEDAQEILKFMDACAVEFGLTKDRTLSGHVAQQLRKSVGILRKMIADGMTPHEWVFKAALDIALTAAAERD